MNTPESPTNLPPGIARKLREIEWRASKFRLFTGLARTVATLITIMLAAMLLDFFVGWLNPGARYAVTSLALGAVAILFVIWCAWPLLHRRSMVDTARNVDEKVPKLEERWSTVAEFAQNADVPEVRGSERMIREVALEADRAGAEINPETLVSREPLFRARRWLLGASALFGVFLLLNFADARVLLHRFWAPGAAVSLTRLNVSPVDVWVPKDEPLMLQATVGGRVPKEPPTLRMRSGSGALKQVTMSPTSNAGGAFQHSIEELSDSFEYRVRAGDGETPWHRITAVSRPEISAVRLTVTPPAYSHLPKQEKESLPNAIRVLQGSELTVAFKSDQALDKMFLRVSETQSLPLAAGEDNWYYYRSVATEGFAFAAVALNKYSLENKNKPSSRVSVYEDRPPTVKVVAPSDEIAVLPGEKVNVTFEASDDFGLAKAEVIVATTKAGGESSTVTLPVNLEADEGKKQFRKSVMLDLKALGLKHGDQLNYIVQVTDTKQTPAQAGAASQALANRAEQNGAGETNEQNSDPKDASSLAQSPLEQEEAPANDAEQRAAADRSALAAKTGQPGNEPASRQTSSPPPNEMSKRLLDAGQSAACKPRNISIDEWAGTFEGEKRRKLEIAIAPVLAQLAALLKNADEKTDRLKPAAASSTGLGPRDAESLSGAKTDLGESEGAISSLKTRTTGTPYAFAGLQLHNIGAAHVTPSHDNLNRVTVDPPQPPTNAESISKASFHIGRAREMLADLTRTFENVKRDQQVADAMQKLAKMHQLFIEDTQALLGSAPGPINSYDRKIAEVDEQFVAKLKELLEEKKKIMAELAKLLSEDPRLLRRYLAMQQLQISSYRDQMTLLAERQKQFQQEITGWNAAPDEQRTNLLSELAQRQAADKKLIGAATALRENMETWLPLDVTPDARPVQAAFRQAEQILQLTVSETRSEAAAGRGLLDEVRKLRTAIPQLDQIESKDKPRMTAYIANRMAEIASLEEACARHLAIIKSLRGGDFAKAAQITQHGITQDTTVLGEKLAAMEQQVARLSEEIAAKAQLLNKTVQGDIVAPQRKTFDRFAEKDVAGAGEILKPVVPAFALAEQTFDELMRLIIAKLDEAPAPTAAGAGEAPNLEALLAMLQDEMKASEGLGIPCRPLNIAMMSDWMKPGMGQGMGQGVAQAQAAQAQSQQAKADAERIEKEARESAEKAAAKALAEAKSSRPPADDVANARRAAAWNKLASSLQKDLLQGRDNTPPEEYREAIENYFKIISEATVPIEE